MVKKRVYELSHDLNLSSKELVRILTKLGIPVTNHMSNLEPNDVERVYQHLAPPEEKKIVEERVKPSVIRRRIERLKPQSPADEAPAESLAPSPGPGQELAPPVIPIPQPPAPEEKHGEELLAPEKNCSHPPRNLHLKLLPSQL